MDVIVKVVTIVKNTYIELSTSTLRVKGSDDQYNVSAKITGYDGIVNPEKFTWEVR